MVTKILSLFYLFAILNIARTLTLSDELQTFFTSIHEKCKLESGATEASIMSTLNGGALPEDYEYKCYVKCTMMELGPMSEDGEVDVDAAVAKLPEEMLNLGIGNYIRTCATKKGDDICESAWLILKCIQSQDPTNFLTI